MATPVLSSDAPETNPDNDELGYVGLARAIAKSIEVMVPQDGLVMSLSGEWGSGKTTVINFVKTYLSGSSIQIVEFNPWWFSNSEDLVVKLLHEIDRVVDPVTTKVAEASRVFGDLLSVFSPMAKNELNLGGDSMRLTRSSIPEMKANIGSILVERNCKLLVIVDDIDRLSTTELRDLFRAIKAIGNLPNIVYLLVLDRNVVAKALDDAYPSRGSEYLDKIIQVGFDLPTPHAAGIYRLFRKSLNRTFATLNQRVFDQSRFDSLYQSGIRHLLRKPRNAVRLSNALAATIPSVVSDVNLSDFIALESLRLLLPKLYYHIRDNKDKFTWSTQDSISSDDVEELERFHQQWVDEYDESYPWIRKFLSILFPSIIKLGNFNYRDEQLRESIAFCRRDLRICSPVLFDIYFQFAVPEDSVSLDHIAEFLNALREGRAGEILDSRLNSSLPSDADWLWNLFIRLPDHLNEIDKEHIIALLNVLLERSFERFDQTDLPVKQFEGLLVNLLFELLEHIPKELLIQKLIDCMDDPQLNVSSLCLLLKNLLPPFRDFRDSRVFRLIVDADLKSLAREFCKRAGEFDGLKRNPNPETFKSIIQIIQSHDPDLLNSVLNKFATLPVGAVAIVMFGLTVVYDSQGTRMEINLQEIAAMIEPKLLIASIEEASKLSGQTSDIAKAFLQEMSLQRTRDATQ